jgi:hypothetical protein
MVFLLMHFVVLLCFDLHIRGTAAETGNLNCSTYTLDPNAPSTDLAYKWFPPGTATGRTWNAAKVFCESICTNCRLAISRYNRSNEFLYGLAIEGRTANNSHSSTQANWIGLRLLNGTWTWLDGQTCNPTDQSDKRCFNTTIFDSSNPLPFASCVTGLTNIGMYFERSFLLDDTDENSFGDGSMICETPGKQLLLK